jgi:two-component system chemotaxis sensor kinase CheA
VDRRSGTDRRQPPASDSASIRVRIDKIDALINMVGELVITQAMLSQLGEGFDMGRMEKLRDGLDQLERNTHELQESIMRIRMLPISFAFNRFPRLVHDLSQKLGKKVSLRLSGEQTELDKTVMEKISDPLVHLVRNALDHGIESPHDRVAAGKPETGVLHLNAYHHSGNIVVEVSDDGAGIQKVRLLEKARRQGLAAADEDLTDDKILELIFLPGITTAQEISDVSGRGVGMDVVRRNIRELGGNIEIRSVEGQGTTITIRLPLTLAILDGQLVRIGRENCIIPLTSICESLQVEAQNVSAIAGQVEIYTLRGSHIPIIRLAGVFGLNGNQPDLTNSLLVVVEADGQRVGLVVDELLGQQQVVIKSLETNFKRVEGVSGATILGDGTVALIVDIAGVIALSRRSMERGRESERAGSAVPIGERA